MRRPLLHSSLSAVALVAALCVLAGCSRPVGSVSGKVTYNGKNLKGGGVTFMNTEGGQSFAAGIAEDGTYSIPNIAGGTYKITVDTSSLKPAQGGAYGGASMPKGAKGMGPPPGADVPEGYSPSSPAAAAAATNAKRYVEIPAKYADPNQTDLTFTFNGGSVTHDIELK